MVLRYLDVYEVDEFVIKLMRATTTAPEVLADIVEGNIKCSEDQVANAIAILGELREPPVSRLVACDNGRAEVP